MFFTPSYVGGSFAGASRRISFVISLPFFFSVDGTVVWGWIQYEMPASSRMREMKSKSVSWYWTW